MTGCQDLDVCAANSQPPWLEEGFDAMAASVWHAGASRALRLTLTLADRSASWGRLRLLPGLDVGGPIGQLGPGSGPLAQMG